MTQIDILIVGSGITGTSLARELSRYKASVLVLDRGPDIAEGATKANSGIIHAGYDAVPGTLKAKYNVTGAAMYESLSRALGVPYKKCGALVIGFNAEDRSTLEHLYSRGLQNGVKNLRLLNHEEVLKKEQHINQEVLCALDVPESAIVSPYEIAYALADDAAMNDVRFLFGQNVKNVFRNENGEWNVLTDCGGCFSCKVFVNCAGASGADIHNMISQTRLHMTNRRGQYYLLDRPSELPFSRTIFQCPSPMGKGVLISPTVHGNIIVGPNAEDIPDPTDTATTYKGLDEVLKKATKTWPGLSLRTNITNFSGIRAHLDTDDFIIGPVPGAMGAFEAIGIESPGLSSAPAIAADLSGRIADYLCLERKKNIVSYTVSGKPFHEMDNDERKAAVESDPLYGNIICRCETVTEAEIIRAIHRPVGAKTIDGIKRRTRAGMGRCQGGFCSPRVAQIISNETGIPVSEITKDGGGSRILFGSIDTFLKGESADD